MSDEFKAAAFEVAQELDRRIAADERSRTVSQAVEDYLEGDDPGELAMELDPEARIEFVRRWGNYDAEAADNFAFIWHADEARQHQLRMERAQAEQAEAAERETAEALEAWKDETPDFDRYGDRVRGLMAETVQRQGVPETTEATMILVRGSYEAAKQLAKTEQAANVTSALHDTYAPREWDTETASMKPVVRPSFEPEIDTVAILRAATGQSGEPRYETSEDGTKVRTDLEPGDVWRTPDDQAGGVEIGSENASEDLAEAFGELADEDRRTRAGLPVE